MFMSHFAPDKEFNLDVPLTQPVFSAFAAGPILGGLKF